VSFAPPPRGTFKIIRQVTIREEELRKIADILGIPEAQAHLISGKIYIGAESSTSGGDATPSSEGAP
jgi:hypothetical protein